MSTQGQEMGPARYAARGMYDVAILGSGLGGTILGAILAKNGVKVLILEQGVHPRFTIGESTVPETTMLFRVLAARYDVPEIEYLSSYFQIQRHIGASCGVKRNFSFLWHGEGERQQPEQTTQFNTAGPPLGPDVHLFRQDTDAFMLAVAVQYGATVQQRTDIVDVDVDSNGVMLRSRVGQEFRARFVVDAGGLKSMMATKLDLRVNPCPLKTRSRSIFTHMVGVTPYDRCQPRNPGLISPPSQGTLHHLFDRGWMWVIPFNNHPLSKNRLVSVGINLDVDVHPRPPQVSPEDEFWSHVRRFPSIAEQFRDAVPIREWTGTDRIQFLSTSSIGDRFCMLPHAFGFIDPLYSSGLGITMSAINSIAARLIGASRDGDYSTARFEYVDHWMKSNIAYFDRLVSNSYLAFQSFPLWNAWTRIWMIGGLLGSYTAYEMLTHAQRSADPLKAPIFEQFPYRGTQASEVEEYASLFASAEAEMNAVRSGALTPDEASGRIFELIERSAMWPEPWGRIHPTRRRHADSFTLYPLYRNCMWIRHRAPAGVRKHLYVMPRPRDMVWQGVKEVASDLRDHVVTFGRLVRDYFKDWNDDWKTALPGAKAMSPRLLPDPIKSERPKEATISPLTLPVSAPPAAPPQSPS
jgi:FADH2 O2-dependent halogenase